MLKRNLLYVVIVGLFFVTSAYSQKETKTVSKTIKPYSGKSFSLKNFFGEVIITGTDKNEVSIVAKISSKRGDAKKIVNDIDIRIDESSSSIDVETIIPKYLTKDRKDDNTEYNYNIDYTISLPKKTSLKIDNSFCTTDIKDISSKVDVKNTFGKLVLKNIGGGLDIISEFGEMKINDVSGNISISNEFGTGKVKNITGNIEVKSNFGDISIENVKGNINIKESDFSNVSTKNVSGTVNK